MPMKSAAIFALVVGAFAAGSVQASVSVVDPMTPAVVGTVAVNNGASTEFIEMNLAGDRGHQRHERHMPRPGPKFTNDDDADMNVVAARGHERHQRHRPVRPG